MIVLKRSFIIPKRREAKSNLLLLTMLCHSVFAFIFPLSTWAPTFPSSSVNDFQLFFYRYYYYYHSQPFLLSHHQHPFILSYPPFYTMILSWTFFSNPFAYECDLPVLFFFSFSPAPRNISFSAIHRFAFVLSTCVWHGSSFWAQTNFYCTGSPSRYNIVLRFFRQIQPKMKSRIRKSILGFPLMSRLMDKVYKTKNKEKIRNTKKGKQ